MGILEVMRPWNLVYRYIVGTFRCMWKGVCVLLCSFHSSHVYIATVKASTSLMEGDCQNHSGKLLFQEAVPCTYRWVNSLRPRQNGHHFADDNLKHIFLNENVRISIKISLNFVSTYPINNIPALVQIMAWRRPGNKLLSEPMMVRLAPVH